MVIEKGEDKCFYSRITRPSFVCFRMINKELFFLFFLNYVGITLQVLCTTFQNHWKSVEQQHLSPKQMGDWPHLSILFAFFNSQVGYVKDNQQK